MSKWTTEQAQQWYDSKGWIQGVNFIPSSAANQIEMWQDFDEGTIQRELAWASELNYNGLRVFLHDQMFQYEGESFLDKIDRFLGMAAQLGMQTVLVLLEGIWDPLPQYHTNQSQLPPRPLVHNSRWLQSPGRIVLENETLQEELIKPYVQRIMTRFGNDSSRVLLFDLFDQPENDNRYSYGTQKPRVDVAQDAFGTELDSLSKARRVEQLVPKLIDWVRDVGTLEVPITIPAWTTLPMVDEPSNSEYTTLQAKLRKLYLDSSDILTFHNYEDQTNMLQVLQKLREAYPNRPVVLSSFMARETYSTFDPILGTLYKENVWAFNWGFVSGKTQTIFPADSWNIAYLQEPNPWHHDVLRADGTPYLESEKEYLLSYQDDSAKDVQLSQPSSPIYRLFPFVVFVALISLVACCVRWSKRDRSSAPRFEPVHAEEEGGDFDERRHSGVEMRQFTID